MSKNIYIIRHGQTDYNLAGYYQGCLLNPSLNEYGKKQAEYIKDKLIKHNLSNIEYIYTSPLRRAYETAKIISGNNYFVMTSLIEGDFGIIEGKTEQEIMKKYPEDFLKWKDLNNLDFKFQNEESKKEIGERILKSVKTCASNFMSNNTFIVTHSAAIRCLLLVLGIKEEEIPFNRIYHFEGTNISSSIFSSSNVNTIKFIESF